VSAVHTEIKYDYYASSTKARRLLLGLGNINGRSLIWSWSWLIFVGSVLLVRNARYVNIIK